MNSFEEFKTSPNGGDSMKNHLREAVESVKDYYVERLVDKGLFLNSDQDPYGLTLTELEYLYNKYCKI